MKHSLSAAPTLPLIPTSNTLCLHSMCLHGCGGVAAVSSKGKKYLTFEATKWDRVISHVHLCWVFLQGCVTESANKTRGQRAIFICFFQVAHNKKTGAERTEI